jgi:hypothetical protein
MQRSPFPCARPERLDETLIPVRGKVFSKKRQLAFFAKDVADSLLSDPQHHLQHFWRFPGYTLGVGNILTVGAYTNGGLETSLPLMGITPRRFPNYLGNPPTFMMLSQSRLSAEFPFPHLRSEGRFLQKSARWPFFARKVFTEKRQLAFFGKDVADSLLGDSEGRFLLKSASWRFSARMSPTVC